MKPLIINNLDIAHKQEVLSGEIPVASFDRLEDILDETIKEQKLRYTLSGTTTKLHLPSLALSVEVALPVICQRCLQVMQLKLSLDYEYVISASEPEPFEGDDDVDWLEVSREMNVNELIEDELLMAIPLARTHENACKPVKHESGERHNPFATLKDLIK